MLSMRNPDGGFGSYGLVQCPSWVELLNPSEVFRESHPDLFVTALLICVGDLMVETEHPECTSSVLSSLYIFRKHYPNYRADEIE
jgi:lanosterol synthase